MSVLNKLTFFAITNNYTRKDRLSSVVILFFLSNSNTLFPSLKKNIRIKKKKWVKFILF